ncbi:hypothetical protein HHI36_013485 [Cryptolaemus montrouzieri]|uniref:Uncharacterized protein n=1 Tax=Cryptolaemus montrouzieri TaxID=559131 RepID=A0ABD2NID8_9CUCU
MIRHKKSKRQRYTRRKNEADIWLIELLEFFVRKTEEKGKKFESHLISSNNVFKYLRSTMCTEVATLNLKDNSGNLCKSPVEVANVLADFFTASFTSEPNQLPNSTTPRNLNELCDIEFTPSLVV